MKPQLSPEGLLAAAKQLHKWFGHDDWETGKDLFIKEAAEIVQAYLKHDKQPQVHGDCRAVEKIKDLLRGLVIDFVERTPNKLYYKPELEEMFDEYTIAILQAAYTRHDNGAERVRQALIAILEDCTFEKRSHVRRNVNEYRIMAEQALATTTGESK